MILFIFQKFCNLNKQTVVLYNMSTLNDQHYIDKVLQGDTNSFAVLVNRYKDMIFSLALKMVKNREEAEEVAQDTFIKIYNSLTKFKGESKFSTWAYRVALNTAITLYRKSTRSVNTVTYEAQQHFFVQDEYNHEEEERLKLMYQAVQQLNDIEKALVYMYLEDKDYTEIAETLGISEVNARVKMNRIKGKLIKILNP